MPIYEYECGACGYTLEVSQKMSEPALKTCNSCGQDKLEKLISMTSFQLKGGGWYSDLYGSTRKGGTTTGAAASSSSTSGSTTASASASTTTTSTPKPAAAA